MSGIFEPAVHGLYFVTTSCLSTAGTNFHVYIARNENQILCKSIAAGNLENVYGIFLAFNVMASNKYADHYNHFYVQGKKASSLLFCSITRFAIETIDKQL